MPWIFDCSTGKQYDPSGKLVGIGYAGGNCGHNPEGVNNPALQAAKCVGPLPYGPKEDGTPNGYTLGTPVEGSHLGPLAIPLIPDSDNIMFGRGSFYVHADLISGPPHSASEGCNVQSHTVRAAMAESSDNRLLVVNGYKLGA